jgi:hypothetical protein
MINITTPIASQFGRKAQKVKEYVDTLPGSQVDKTILDSNAGKSLNRTVQQGYFETINDPTANSRTSFGSR